MSSQNKRASAATPERIAEPDVEKDGAKGPRRKRGEGGVRFRRGRWEGSVSYIDDLGRRRRKTVSAKTEAVCGKAMRKVQVGIDEGRMPADERAGTLGQYGQLWLKEKAGEVEAGTLVPYQSHFEQFILPGLGAKPLSKLRRIHVKSFYAWLRTARVVNGKTYKAMSAGMQRKVRTTLNVILNAAVEDEIIDPNPAAGITMPKADSREVRAMTIDQAAALVTACKGERFGALFALLLDAGLRPSEGLALQWSDIDFGTGRVSITKSLDRFATVLGPKETKTKGSKRTLPVGPQTLELLNGHRAAALRDGRDISPAGIVFANDAGGYADLSSLHRRHYRPLLKHAGLPMFSLYALRHTSATLLMAAGVNAKIVAERLGHAGVGMTLKTYSHVSEGMQAEATAVIARLLAAKSVPAR